MPLILAIEPDRRQVSKIAALAKNMLRAELVASDSTEHAVAALAGRVPDLILTSLLLSPKDGSALSDWLRELDAAGNRVQTLVIPVLATSPRRSRKTGGLLNRLRSSRDTEETVDGCDPAVFGAQIAEYLHSASEERRAADEFDDDAEEPAPTSPPPSLLAEARKSTKAASPAGKPVEPPFVIEAARVIAPPPVVDLPVTMAAPPASIEASPVQPLAVEPAPVLVEAITAAEGADDQAVETVDVSAAREQALAEPAFSSVEPVRTTPGEDSALVEFAAALDAVTIDARVTTAREDISDSVGEGEPEGEGEPDSDLWMPLSSGQSWPPLNAHSAANRSEASRLKAEAERLTAEASQVRSEGSMERSVAGSSARPEWLDVLAAIQEDIKLMQPTIPAWKPPRKSAAAARPNATAESPQSTASDANRKKKKRKAPPQDEWGFFDPDQCGFAALLAKLDEISDDEKPKKPRG
jgi:hypothetical protein